MSRTLFGTTLVGIMFRHFGNRAFIALESCLVASACEHRDPPKDIRLELPSVIEARDPVAVTVHVTNAQGVTSTLSEGADFALEPKDLASVGESGLVRCEHSGDGKLNVSVAGVSRSIALRCRIVDRIEAPDLGRVELSAGPFQPHVRALDRAGTELADVDIAIASKNAGVAFPRDGLLVPKSVGTANLTARAGQASKDFKVDVVRKILVEALPIDGSKRIYFSLGAGKYELKVHLKSPKRVSVEWRGAPYCNGSSDGLEYVSTCALRALGGGGVVFDNPAYLNEGAKTISLDGVELNEVP